MFRSRKVEFTKENILVMLVAAGAATLVAGPAGAVYVAGFLALTWVLQ